VGVFVIVLSGASKGVKKRVGSRLRIGKAPDNDLVLHDATVSRHHCEIVRDPSGTLVVRDLGSRNGTRVGGARVREAEIGTGITLAIGGVDVSLQPSVEPLEVLPSDHDRFGEALGRSLTMRRVPSPPWAANLGYSPTGKVRTTRE